MTKTQLTQRESNEKEARHIKPKTNPSQRWQAQAQSPSLCWGPTWSAEKRKKKRLKRDFFKKKKWKYFIGKKNQKNKKKKTKKQNKPHPISDEHKKGVVVMQGNC